MTVSVIVPTVGRPSLAATLASIETYPGDEVIVIGGSDDVIVNAGLFGTLPLGTSLRHITCAPAGDWGCTERTLGIAHARGDYLAFIDDDDVYLSGHRTAWAAAIAASGDVPILFRMRYPQSGAILWTVPQLKVGNISTQMILIPNDRARLGCWTSRREGDFDFLQSAKWAPSAFAWRPDVIAQLGHEDGRRRRA